jgi:hypothetical protein
MSMALVRVPNQVIFWKRSNLSTWMLYFSVFYKLGMLHWRYDVPLIIYSSLKLTPSGVMLVACVSDGLR